MKKLLAILSAVLLLMPVALADGAGGSTGGSIGVEDFPIKVWQCGERVLEDEDVQPWRISGDSEDLDERNNNYMFEGETYAIDVLVMDKNKIDEVAVDVVFEQLFTGTQPPTPPELLLITLNCVPTDGDCITDCNAMIDEELIEDFDPLTMAMYTCTIEIPDSSIAYGEYELSVQATGHDGTPIPPAEFDETSIWFLNPMLGISVTGGPLSFSGVRPGTSEYSNIQVKNIAEGGVILDMFILGEDWDAVDQAQGRCQQLNEEGGEVDGLLNQLSLGAFRYYVENGAFSSRDDAETDTGAYPGLTNRDSDDEGYLNICKNVNAGFEEGMFDKCEILQANPIPIDSVGTVAYLANLLYPGSTGMTLTFRLSLPEPCYGNFANPSGFTIWGEAV